MKPDAVEFTALTRAELEEVIESIAAHNPGAAMRLRTAIGAMLATLAAHGSAACSECRQRAPRLSSAHLRIRSGSPLRPALWSE